MALLTAGTANTTVLRTLQFQPTMGTGQSKATDLAALVAGIKGSATDKAIITHFDQTGILYIPGKRGFITCQPGDYVAYDPVTGWPIVISAAAMTGGSFVHS